MRWVTRPRAPPPIFVPSTSLIGVTSAAVPLNNLELAPARDGNRSAFLESLSAEICLPGPGKNHHLDRAGARIQTQAVTAVVAEGTDVTIAKVIASHNLADGFGQFTGVERNRHPKTLGRGVEAIKMGVEPKDRRPTRRFVAAHPFEYAGSVMQRVRLNMRGGILPQNHSAVHPHPFTLSEGHSLPLLIPVFVYQASCGQPGHHFAQTCADTLDLMRFGLGFQLLEPCTSETILFHPLVGECA